MRLRAVLAPLLLVAGCSKEQSAERTAPWRAPEPSASAGVPREPVVYVVEPAARARVTLRTRSAAPSGVIAVARGRLSVDLAELSRSTGTIELDLTSLAMDGTDPPDARQRTEQARSWLDLGASRPEPERERLRWASFRITAIDELTATTPSGGRREHRSTTRDEDDGGTDAATVVPRSTGHAGPAASAAPSASTAADGAAPPQEASIERRSVSLRARGELTLHSRRVERTVQLRVTFELSAGSERPTRIVIETRGPFALPLDAVDVKPRDSAGSFLAKEMGRIGSEVGAEASITLWLAATPAP